VVEGPGKCPHVVVEHRTVEVVNGVASLVIAPVKDLAGLAAPSSGPLARLLLIVTALRTADRNTGLNER
jgi:hypothetical protein